MLLLNVAAEWREEEDLDGELAEIIGSSGAAAADDL